RLDLDLIVRLAGVVPVPLVLHGSSGVADAEIRRGIAAGMRKINVSTHLNAVFTAAVRETLVEHPDLVDSRKYLAPAREAFAAEVARLLDLGARRVEVGQSGDEPWVVLADPEGNEFCLLSSRR
ncbi:hypothetical protein DN550_34645, partial [Burkholderia multivorans]